MADLRTQFLANLAQWEGGYVNHPDDPGGRTIYGLSEHAFPEAWANGPPTREQAEDIIWDRFYIRPNLPLISDPILREQVFDWSVNSGSGVAVRALQRLVGAEVDGVIGQETVQKIAAFKPSTLFGQPLTASVSLNLAYEQERVKFLARLVGADRSLSTFLSGWLTRVASFRTV